MHFRARVETVGKVYTTRLDRDCLQALVTRMHRIGMEDRDLARLEEVLESAEVVSTRRLSAKIVTLGSTLKARNLNTGQEHIMSVVLPYQADIDSKRVSILAPLGTAMFGRREGAVIDIKVPAGVKTFRIEKIVMQPEREESAARRRRPPVPAKA